MRLRLSSRASLQGCDIQKNAHATAIIFATIHKGTGRNKSDISALVR
jgi:hypothetical protein